MTTETATLKDRIDALELALPLLNDKDRQFAQDLIDGKWGFRLRGSLSPKQVNWVDILTKRALTTTTAPEAKKVGDFSAVYALFAKAKEHIKFPKIRLLIQDLPLCLSLAGPNAKQPGTVNVTDGEKFGSNRFFGRVNKDGSFTPGFAQANEAETVANILTMLAADPIATAREHGKLTGYCCFCNKSLSDAQSVSAGFGPTCAKTYGLFEQYKQAEKILEVA